MATVTEGTILAPKQDFQVLDARYGDPEPNPRGGPDLQKQWIDVQTTDGQAFSDCYLRTQVGNHVKQGDQVPGEVVQGRYGPMFRKAGRAIPSPNGPQPTPQPQPQTPSQPASQPSSVPVDTDPEAARIARSVAVKGAVDLRAAGAITDGQLLATAQMLSDWILTGERRAA